MNEAGRKALEAELCSLNECSGAPGEPVTGYYPRLKSLLLEAVLQKCIRFSQETEALLGDTGLRRDLALLRRVEMEQAFRVRSHLAFFCHDAEECLYRAALLLETGAALAQRMEDHLLRQTIHFLLPEFLEILYRLAQLLRYQRDESPSAILERYPEIMPGRPLALCHRHPEDDVGAPWPEMGPEDELSCILLIAAVEAFQSACDQAAFHAQDSLERGLMQELSLLAEQHRTLLSSLCPDRPPLIQLRELHAVLCWLRDAAPQGGEKDAVNEQGQRGNAYLERLTVWVRILYPDAPEITIPPPLILGPSKGYVRDSLQTIGHTLRLGRPVPRTSLSPDGTYARYQRRLCPDFKELPSHQVVQQIIAQTGQDERYEIALHPIPSLRDRTRDHWTLNDA